MKHPLFPNTDPNQIINPYSPETLKWLSETMHEVTMENTLLNQTKIYNEYYLRDRVVVKEEM